jgi:P27 family predicted phage terminase small subunit
MRGRKPTPTVLKFLRGNPGKRRVNPREPTAAPLARDCPDELVDADARQEWTRTIAPAITIGQIGASDRALAIAHCDLWSSWRQQSALATKVGHLVVVGPSRYPMPNPARTMANKTLQLLVKVDAELGLTPSSRSRIQLAPQRPPSTRWPELP